MNTDARKPGTVREISVTEWLAEGEALFGPDRDQWRFRCVSCGHEQSAVEARQHNPEVDQCEGPVWLRNYLAQNCEGRLAGPGCNWSLNGLFSIHHRAVINDAGQAVPVFEFAPRALTPKEAQP